MIELTDTTASEISAEFLRARARAGSPAMGMIMTLVIVADESDAETAMSVARSASREHPARILGLVVGNGRGASHVHAEVGIGSGASGERALIRLTGEVTRHAESVVLPLLLPDSPVVVWWPGRAPEDCAADPIGALGTRRITDAAAAPTRKAQAMLTQCSTYTPGNTDLAWTRITGWRAILAAAFDQTRDKVVSASVTAERISPSADLLSAWLGGRLRVDVDRRNSRGPGITKVVLSMKRGDITISRPDGRLATLSSPGEPDRPVALKRRDLDELLAEELRRLDPDEVYAETVKWMARTGSREAPRRNAVKAAKKTAQKTTKKATKASAKETSAARPGSRARKATTS